MTDRLLTTAEVAELLAVPISWVRESTRSGAMPESDGWTRSSPPYMCTREGYGIRWNRV